MKVQSTQQNFGWNIIRQSSRYGNHIVKSTEYYPNNGLKLLVVEKYKNNKLIEKAKTLFDKNWQMIKKKVKYLGGVNVLG